jgi:hypothetical protein
MRPVKPAGMRTGVTGLAVALLFALTGCGDKTDSYCGALEKDRKQIADILGSGSPSALLGNLPLFHDLADKAPDDLTDEWQTFVSALDGLDDAIRRAGVKPSDFKGGKPPAGLSDGDKKAIADAAGQIDTDVADATKGIEQQARDVCKVNLGL